MNILEANGGKSIRKLVLSMILTLGTGVLGSIFMPGARELYDSFALPPFAPPSWLFAPVWIILYILMGYAFYRIMMYDRESAEVKSAKQYFIVQLVFNLLWTILFFGFSLRTAAFADILILLYYLIVTAVKFSKIDRLSGWLMVPVILWVIYASALNLSIILLNG